MTRSTGPSAPARRAFSLVEILVVIGIIAIVIAIVIPMLGGARNAAKKAATVAYLSDMSSAVQQFQADEKRLPGYWSARQLGSTANKGLSAMENMVLELANAEVPESEPLSAGGDVCATVGGPNVVDLDPLGDPDQTRRISIARLGASDNRGKSYFSPDPKYFVRQCGADQQIATIDEAKALPDVVDAWGQPVLAWVQDDLPRVAANDALESFAQIDSDGDRARFYWRSNACFLDATDSGKLGRDQKMHSLLGGAAFGDQSRKQTMAAVLGNPAFPAKSDPNLPGDARAPIIFHSAGADGIFLGRDDRGGKLAGNTGLKYVANQDPIEGGAFDDVMTTSGK